MTFSCKVLSEFDQTTVTFKGFKRHASTRKITVSWFSFLEALCQNNLFQQLIQQMKPVKIRHIHLP